MLNVAMLSKWHVHAGGYANEVNGSGKAKVVAVWDDDAARGSAWASELGCDFVPDLAALLARSDIDAVVCDAPTTEHKDIIIAAAKAGKHIFTEKALCPTVAECLEVKEAVEAAGVTFVISMPQRGRPVIQFAKKMIDEGAFGYVNYIRYRDAHSGVSGNWLPEYWFDKSKAAGGAMMDLGCHPMYLMAYLGGKAKRITALYNAPLGTPVDENAVCTIEFESGALGVAETSFLAYSSPQTLEIYGTEGTLIAHGDDVKFCSKKLSGVVGGFIKPDLPRPKPNPINRFIDACANGTGAPAELNIDAAIDLTRLLELSYIADANNEIIKL